MLELSEQILTVHQPEHHETWVPSFIAIPTPSLYIDSASNSNTTLLYSYSLLNAYVQLHKQVQATLNSTNLGKSLWLQQQDIVSMIHS